MFKTVKELAQVPQRSVSLKEMVQYGIKPNISSLFLGSHFLLNELPLRLAHRVVELQNLPLSLSDMPSIQLVRNWYLTSFQELVNFKEKLPQRDLAIVNYYNHNSDFDLNMARSFNSSFVDVIERIKTRHDPTMTAVATGVLELKAHWRKTNNPLLVSDDMSNLPSSIQAFLDRFYMSRIGIRMLIGQHIAMVQTSINKRKVDPNYVGVICTKTCLNDVVLDSINNAQAICQDYYGLANVPQIQLLGKSDLEFMYVPGHLHHMLFELFKNSLRATVEKYGVDCDNYPVISVIVAGGNEDITIKISDQGGGIPRSALPLVWTYLYTTALNPLIDESNRPGDFRAPLAGYGYGLPLSRLYARYFGGDLHLISMEGYGTDVYLHLSRLSDSDEPLA